MIVIQANRSNCGSYYAWHERPHAHQLTSSHYEAQRSRLEIFTTIIATYSDVYLHKMFRQWALAWSWSLSAIPLNLRDWAVSVGMKRWRSRLCPPWSLSTPAQCTRQTGKKCTFRRLIRFVVFILTHWFTFYSGNHPRFALEEGRPGDFHVSRALLCTVQWNVAAFQRSWKLKVII